MCDNFKRELLLLELVGAAGQEYAFLRLSMNKSKVVLLVFLVTPQQGKYYGKHYRLAY